MIWCIRGWYQLYICLEWVCDVATFRVLMWLGNVDISNSTGTYFHRLLCSVSVKAVEG